jgi:hypothetical protein
MTGLRQSADVRAVAWGGVDWRWQIGRSAVTFLGRRGKNGRPCS